MLGLNGNLVTVENRWRIFYCFKEGTQFVVPRICQWFDMDFICSVAFGRRVVSVQEMFLEKEAKSKLLKKL